MVFTVIKVKTIKKTATLKPKETSKTGILLFVNTSISGIKFLPEPKPFKKPNTAVIIKKVYSFFILIYLFLNLKILITAKEKTVNKIKNLRLAELKDTLLISPTEIAKR